MSTFDAVVVIVGEVPLANRTLLNVLVKEPAPVFRMQINDLPAPTDGIVNVQLPVSVTVCTVPLDKLNV
jgi:hypothetical protein